MSLLWLPICWHLSPPSKSRLLPHITITLFSNWNIKNGSSPHSAVQVKYDQIVSSVCYLNCTCQFLLSKAHRSSQRFLSYKINLYFKTVKPYIQRTIFEIFIPCVHLFYALIQDYLLFLKHTLFSDSCDFTHAIFCIYQNLTQPQMSKVHLPDSPINRCDFVPPLKLKLLSILVVFFFCPYHNLSYYS